MFQDLLELFKRLVEAHERQAEAAMLMTQQPTFTPITAESDGTECTAPKKPRKKREEKAETVETAQPEVSPPAVEPEVLTPAVEPETTLEALKSAAGLYCARRKVAGSGTPAADCAALLQAHAGVSKTMEVPANLRKACLDAFEANWLPAEEDL